MNFVKYNLDSVATKPSYFLCYLFGIQNVHACVRDKDPFTLRSDEKDIEYLFLSYNIYHRLSINRPTKRGKDKSPSDGHCQYQKEMEDHLLVCQQIFEREPHSNRHY
jgi:hypothetical protein